MIIFDFQKDLPGNDMEGWSPGEGGQERAPIQVQRAELRRDGPGSRSREEATEKSSRRQKIGCGS